MNNTQARRKIEEMLGAVKERPRLKYGEHEYKTTVHGEDFILPADFDNFLPRHNTIQAVVTGFPVASTYGTYEEPPDGGYSEEVSVWVKGELVTELLTEEAYERLCDAHFNDADGRGKVSRHKSRG